MIVLGISRNPQKHSTGRIYGLYLNLTDCIDSSYDINGNCNGICSVVQLFHIKQYCVPNSYTLKQSIYYYFFVVYCVSQSNYFEVTTYRIQMKCIAVSYFKIICHECFLLGTFSKVDF